MKRWQRILIIVCAVWLVGGLLAVVLLRDTPEFAQGEATLIIKGFLAEKGVRHTAVTEKYLGQGLWEVRTKLLSKRNWSWLPAVFIVDERTREVRIQEEGD